MVNRLRVVTTAGLLAVALFAVAELFEVDCDWEHLLACFFNEDRTLDKNEFVNLDPKSVPRVVALSMMTTLGPNDVAFSCDFVCCC